MQHHRRKAPARERISPFVAVIGVAVVTTGVVAGTSTPVNQGSPGNDAVDRSTNALPAETTTTGVLPTTTVPMPAARISAATPTTTNTTFPKTNTTLAPATGVQGQATHVPPTT